MDTYVKPKLRMYNQLKTHTQTHTKSKF